MDLVSDVVKRNRLRWLGHVLRNDDGDWVKKSMSYEVEGVRGRHKRAWFEKGGCPGARQVEETAVGSRRGGEAKTAVKRLLLYIPLCHLLKQ